MIPLKITPLKKEGITIIQNDFIDLYMTDANEAQIKVYLYLQRMISENLPTDVAEMAERFNYTEKEVLRSLKYWEKKSLMALSYDENRCLAEVAFTVPTAQAKEEPVSLPITACTFVEEPLPVISKENSKMIPMSIDYEAAKNKYTAGDLLRLSDDSNVSMLRVIAEQYFGRPLSTAELKSLLFIYDRLNFSIDLADYLLEYCFEKGQKDILYIEQMAINWYEKGITTEKQARNESFGFDRSEETILSFLGKTGKAAPKELEYIRRWTIGYKFSLSIIEEACGRAVLNTEKNRFAYADSILKSWHSQGVRTKADIAKADKAFEDAKSQRKIASTSSKKDSAFCFKDNSSDDDVSAVIKALTH